MANKIKRLWSAYKRKRSRYSIGLSFRNKIHKFALIIHPYAVVLFPNFRVVHYTYITFMVFLGSVLLYPVRNIPYIDILFTTAGASTQAGLNTVNFNELTLYQQIMIYIIATLTTPIFIHGSLLFVRLYWFERHFDNIKESSKLNFKMRRNATLAARTRSFDSTRINTVNNQGLGFNPRYINENQNQNPLTAFNNDNGSSNSTSLKDDDHQNQSQNSSPQSSSTIQNNQNSNNIVLNHQLINTNNNNNNNDVIHLSEPSDTDDDTEKLRYLQKNQKPLTNKQLDRLSNTSTAIDPIKSATPPTLPDDEGIKFGNLPHPSKHTRKKEIEPSDMYMSIAMLQNNHKNASGLNLRPSSPVYNQSNINGNNSNHNNNNNEVGDDDVLVIKSPNEIENDIHNPIFTKKRNPQIQFNVNDKPMKKSKRSSNHVTNSNNSHHKKHNKKWSKLKKSFTNNNTSVNEQKNPPLRKLLTNDLADEDQSIDSENDDFEQLTTGVNDNDDADDEHAIDDDEDTDDDYDTKHRASKNHPPHHDGEESDTHDGNDGDDIQRARSNLVLPSSDATGGKKIGKRSNTLEITPGRSNSFLKSSTFEKQFRPKSSNSNHLNKKTTYQTGKKKLRRLRTPSFHRLSSIRTGDNNEDVDEDDDSFDDTSEESSDYDYDDEEVTRFSSGDNSLRKTMSTNYLSWIPTIGRNSTFVHLSEEQKEELGGVEYRAVKLLIKILLTYYIGFHIIAFLIFVPWIQTQSKYSKIIRDIGVSPTWWGFFTAQSSFNDLGFTLTPDSMQSFNTSVYVMVFMSFFIVIGNTGFPVLLRFIIWILFKVSKPLSLLKESLGFLLDHPRRCFTLLFPSVPTWWLFSILVVLNAVDLILFIILDLHSTYLSHIKVGYRVMDGLFQAFSTRTAGFAVIDLSQLHPAIQVSYMLMMYISVLPLAISIRRTNVYEEQSLGLYLKEENQESDDVENSTKTFIGTHLRNQLSFDLWFIFLGLFIICIAEGGKLNNQDVRFSVFSILFEIISAYGTVGLSLGYPNTNESFSKKFSTVSKLVMIAMMIRGRHRGLPYALDRAIMLPDADMERRDEVQENHAIRRNATFERANTNMTDVDDNHTVANDLKRAFSRKASNIPGLDNVFSKRRHSSSFFSSPSNNVAAGSNSGVQKPRVNDPMYVVNDPNEEEHELDDMIRLEHEVSNNIHKNQNHRNSQSSPYKSSQVDHNDHDENHTHRHQIHFA